MRDKFGVEPKLIPDWLALAGDQADGYPGIPRLGPVTASRLIGKHGVIENFPASVLGARRELALLFKQLATLRTDTPLFEEIEQLCWRGPTLGFGAWAERCGEPRFLRRSAAASTWA